MKSALYAKSKVPMECPSCHAPEWVTDPNTKEVHTLIMKRKDSATERPMITCTKCGLYLSGPVGIGVLTAWWNSLNKKKGK